MIDEYTRERLAIDVAGSIRSGRVIEVLPSSSPSTVHKYLRSDDVLEAALRGQKATESGARV